MWSSLSSYLYNDTVDDGGESRQATHRHPTPRSRATSHRDERHIIEHADAAAASSAGHTSGRGGNRPISLQTSLHSASSNNSGGSANKQRRVSTPKASSATNTTILRGIIVGEEQSGKTSLIRRLRGEDPFLQDRNEHQEQLDDGSDSRRKKRNVMALLPWKVPEQTPFQQKHPHATLDAEDDVVQLYISEGKSFCYTNKERPFHKQWVSILQSHKGKECNFVVWMIDPRIVNVLGYLQEGLDVLFQPPTAQDENENDEKAKDKKVKQQPLIQNLCILLNFRDLNPSQQKESNALVDQVQQIVNTVIERLPGPTILVYESSMKNCFGLQNLHSFITLPYLSHKERELRRRAENARKQHTQWKKGLEEYKVMKYTDFIKQRVEQQKKQANASTPRSKQALERQSLVEEKELLQRQLQQQNQMLRAKAGRQEQSDEDEVGSPSSIASRQRQTPVSASPPKQIGINAPAPAPLDDGNTAGQRKLFAKSQPQPKPQQEQQQHPAPVKKAPPKPPVVEHTNLDAFFSDDEEDDADSVGNVSSESSNGDDDEDSDDEDFFIDGTGTRRAHANAPPVSYKQRTTKQKEKKPFAKTPGLVVKSQSNKDEGVFSKEEDKLNTSEQPPSQPDQKVQASKKVDKSDQVKKPTVFAPAGGAVKNDEGPISSSKQIIHHTDKGTEESEQAFDQTPATNEEQKIQSDDGPPKDDEGVGSENKPETLGDGSAGEQPSPLSDGSKAPVPLDPNNPQGTPGDVKELQTGVSSSTNTNESIKQDDTVTQPPSSSRDQKQIERGTEELENVQDVDMNIDELGEGIGSANKSASADDNKVESEKDIDTKAREQATLSSDCSKAIVEVKVADGKSETNTTEDESASSSKYINETKEQDDTVSENESETVQAQLPEASDENNGSLGNDDPSDDIENAKPVVEDDKPWSDNGDNNDGSQDKPSSKTDSPSRESPVDAGMSEQKDPDAEHRDAETDREAEEICSSTETVDTEGQHHTKQQVQNEAVLDSDDDSTGGAGEGGQVKQKNQSHVEDDESDEDFIIDTPKSSVETPLKPKDGEEKLEASSEDGESDEELIIDAPKVAASDLPAEIPPKSAEDKKKPTSTSPPVSSAALAAIEAAKREAEQMMAQLQTTAAPSDGKVKKSKKEKKAKKEKRRERRRPTGKG